MSKPCPCCDIEIHELGPFAALAFGVALGDAFRGEGGIADKMCPRHRLPYILSVAKAAMAMNVADAAALAEDTAAQIGKPS